MANDTEHAARGKFKPKRNGTLHFALSLALKLFLRLNEIELFVMAITLPVFLPTSSLSPRISKSGTETLYFFTFPLKNFFGPSKALESKFPSKTIGRSCLSKRMPRYKLLQSRAGMSFGDGDTGSKPGQVSSEKPRDVGLRSEDGDENQHEKGSIMPMYGWTTGLAVLGFMETSYLTYMKVTGSDVYCPAGGSGCGDVLNSDYATILGVPLPLIGMIGYGVIAFVGLQLSRRNMVFGVDGDKARWVLLGCTSAMAAASAYFMYLLIAKFEGASCAYCVTSALLSFSLLLITLRDFSVKEVIQVAGIQITMSALVIAALSTAYAASESAQVGLDDVYLPPVEPVVTTHSSPEAISLARHLQSVGAKLYGAFWCSHCFEQKQMFGREAMEVLDYVECYPRGYRKGVVMEKSCRDANLQGFPTWIIKGQVLSGEQDFAELARVSGFNQSKAHT